MSPWRLVVSVSAVLCLTLGILSLAFFGQFMRQKIAEHLSLRVDGGDTLRVWRDLPAPFQFRVFLFHVENAAGVVSRGDRPRVAQRGPYTYREHRHKDSLRFYENDTVSFRERRLYSFVPEESAGSEGDVLTALNIPAMSAALLSERLPRSLRVAVSVILSSLGEGSAFRRLTVRQLLWGYGDPLTRALNSLSPRLWPSPQFGMLAGFNDTDSAEFLVNTGVRDISRVHEILSWNGMTQLPYWQSARCNRISGTPGEMWAPLHNQSLPLTFFSPDTCRTLELRVDAPRDVGGVYEGGLPVWRFTVPPTLFADAASYPPNAGFGPGLGSGAMNMSACRQGAPVFVSQPHFFQGDAGFVSNVSGMRPDAGQHQSFIDIHPETGIPINVSIRLQINVYIHAVPEILLTGHIKPVLLPIMWFSESGHMPAGELRELWISLVLVPTLAAAASAAMVALGGGLAAALLLAAAVARRRGRRRGLAGAEGAEKRDSETTALLGR